MPIYKLKYKQSLNLKVLIPIISLAATINIVAGVVIQNQISESIINEKISISKVETQNSLQIAQGNFNNVRFKSDEELNQVIQQFIASSQEDGLISGRETILLPISKDNKSTNIYQTGTTLLALNSIPQDFREKIKVSDKILMEKITVKYSTGENSSGFVIGSKLNIPRTGVYEIYYIFKLDKQLQTVHNLTLILVATGFLLILLIGLGTTFVIKQVISPVRSAVFVADKFRQGDFTSRMPISSKDELARLGNSFNAMADSIQEQIFKLENLSMLQQRFVSDVSHELRTPLTTLKMAAEVIYQNKDNFESSVARSSELLINQIERFESLLSDLLEVSRFDAEAATLELTIFNIVISVKNVVDYLHPSKSSQCVVNTTNDYIQIQADQRRVERILRNLVSNAIDHSEGKPVQLYIAESDNEVSIGVRDFGLGFSDENKPLLFDRFWRADPSRTRSSGGSGLGLSIALEDTKLHHGQLSAWGRLNQGAHFVLTLPKNSGNTIQSYPIALVPQDFSSTE